MAKQPDWVPDEVDTDRPSIARAYDYVLGGVHNFEVDRRFADEVERHGGNAFATGRGNRAFLRRAVRFLADSGVEQFLDLGSGVPTVGNVHEIAQQRNPEARVVYVDIDPTATAHSRALLADNPRAGVIQADVRDTDTILSHPELQRLIDFTEPVALMFVLLLHFIPDADDPGAIVGRFVQAAAPGSYLVISHVTLDDQSEDWNMAARAVAKSTTDSAATFRPRDQVLAMFQGLDLVDPGLVGLHQWRPDGPLPSVEEQRKAAAWAGIGRKA